MEVIYFYSTQGEYGCFSNFSRHSFELDGKYWKTSEHYFQAQKFAGTAYEEQVRLASTAKQAAALGRRRDFPLRKFETHADIRATLLATGDRDLIENAPGDYYWGCGRDGTGQNRLGHILMETRARLRSRE